MCNRSVRSLCTFHIVQRLLDKLVKRNSRKKNEGIKCWSVLKRWVLFVGEHPLLTQNIPVIPIIPNYNHSSALVFQFCNYHFQFSIHHYTGTLNINILSLQSFAMEEKEWRGARGGRTQRRTLRKFDLIGISHGWTCVCAEQHQINGTTV